VKKLLPKSFYLQSDVVETAKQLLGKVLVSCQHGIRTAGIITETEAYAGEVDRASHAYGGKRTKRTETMFMQGGVAYVYLCYGIHSLFNVVTNKKDIPHAVLIRAIEPIEGTDTINLRLQQKKMKPEVNGPAKVTVALALDLSHNGISLHSDLVRIEDYGIKIPSENITATPRIGVDYAGEDAKLLYRFIINKPIS
jgi:DNA-3-methyladenine glycosylase